MIPARYAATRFPAKLMQLLGNKSVIRHVFDNAAASGLFNEVVVVTDSRIIYDDIVSNGGRAMMSKNDHESGCDRIVEAVKGMEADIIVNVQGDVPFVNRESLGKLLAVFADERVQVASLMQVLKEKEFIWSPDFVKVVVDNNSNALLFSRNAIPYDRSENGGTVYYEHIGIYAFRKKALLDFSICNTGTLEAAEKIECLRFIENGIPIRMVVTDFKNIQIDTPEDLVRAEAYLREGS